LRAHIEKGKYKPSHKLTNEIAIALHSKIDELFMWDEDTAKNN
jgi:DNA-binding XRE family transcriptional regulator